MSVRLYKENESVLVGPGEVHHYIREGWGVDNPNRPQLAAPVERAVPLEKPADRKARRNARSIMRGKVD